MTDFLASDVVIDEKPPAAITAPSLATAVVGMVGVAERGPYGATLVTSWDEYLEKFGGFTANADLTVAAYFFFKNCGRGFLWVARTCHYTDPADASTKTSVSASKAITTTGAATQGVETSGNTETFNLEPGDTVIVKVDAGATQTATFDAAAGTVSGTAGTFPTGFTGGETLLVKIDGGVIQTITFTAAATTIAVVLSEINAQLAGGFADDDGGEVRITSDKRGTASYVEVTGGTGRATLDIATGVNQGTGDVADIDAVTAAEAKTIIEADTTAQVTVEGTGEISIKTPTVGASGSIQVDATSTADDAAKFDLDNAVHAGTAAGPGTTGTATAYSDGAWGNNVVVRIAAATSGDSDEFNLQILESGVVKETFYSLSTVVANSNYWLTVVNHLQTGSIRITLADSLTGVPPANRPTNGDYALTGGNDGLAGIIDADYQGDSTGKTGIFALDTVDDLTILAVPGRATSAVHNSMVTYAETTRAKQVFAILDPPAAQTALQMRTYVRTTASLYDLTENAAIYWPQVNVQNPSPTVFTSDVDGNITIAPSGAIAGVYVRTDRDVEGGVHKAPAGTVRGKLVGVSKFETDTVLDKTTRDIVFPSNINPLTTWSGTQPHIDGPKCLKTSGLFASVGERRGMSHIERLIKLTVRNNVHDDNTPELRDQLTRTVRGILKAEMDVGAFRTKIPATAFFVDFGDALNTADVIKANKLKGKVGVAKAKPAYWIVIEISEDLELAA
ncbi:MAG: phage tail protein [bacterium]|nr:phage tail protein [bacterium]